MSKILLVEDDPTNAEIVTRILTIKNHDVVHAADGPAGVSLAGSERPDLILMDMLLPNRGDGQKATREIRALDGLAAVPILALTALCMPDEVKEMYEAGCTDVVLKPIDFNQLLGKIANLLTLGTKTRNLPTPSPTWIRFGSGAMPR